MTYFFNYLLTFNQNESILQRMRINMSAKYYLKTGIQLCTLIFILLVFGGFILPFVTAQGGNGGGSGQQGPQDGKKKYQFANNIDIDLTVDIPVTVRMTIDPELANRFVGIRLNASNLLELNLSMQKSFHSPPGERMRWQGGHGNQGPTSLKLDSPKELDSIDITSQGKTEDEVTIENPYSTYFIMNLNITVDYLEFYTTINENLGLPEDSTFSWAIFDESSDTWFLLDSTVNEDTISTIFTEEITQDTKFTVTIVSLSSAPSFWTTPAGIAIIVIGIFGITFGLLMSKTEYRNYLLNRFLPIEKGPHRLTMEDVLENENRDFIIKLILEQPGIHFNELLRQVGLTAGNLAWHLDILETFKIIRKQRMGQYLLYYPYLEKNPISKLDPKLQKSKTTLEIMQLIGDHPGIYQNQIARRMDLDHKTVKYHLDKLLEVEIIETRKNGRLMGFYPKNIPKDLEQNASNPEMKENQ